MICRKCKRETPSDARFCPYCGVLLEARKHKPRTRPNGTGTAVKRGTTWTARVVVCYEPVPDSNPPRKKAVYRTKGGFKTKRDALDYCAVLKQKDYKPQEKAPVLNHYWNQYSTGEMKKLSKNKQSAYNTAWKKIADQLKYRPANQITVSELRDVVSEAANTYYTVKDCKTILTHIFELAGADGWCSKDLPSYIVLPALEETEREPFTDDEQSALWKLYESGDLRAAVPLLMICTGIMPGEIQKLKVENIDIEHQKIINAGIKTKVRRRSDIYFPEDIIPVIEDLIANARPNGFLWVQNEKKWYENYYAALEAAGCRRLEPYSCRHTTATRLAIDKNIAPQTIQRIMRWSSTKMLDRYAHPDEVAVISAANTLNKAEVAENKSEQE